MKKMFFTILLSLFCTLSFADHHEKKGEMKKTENFAKRKEMILGLLDKRIATLNEHKTCITNASKNEDIKACRMKMREHAKKLREEAKKARRERKEAMKKMKKEEKKK